MSELKPCPQKCKNCGCTIEKNSLGNWFHSVLGIYMCQGKTHAEPEATHASEEAQVSELILCPFCGKCAEHSAESKGIWHRIRCMNCWATTGAWLTKERAVEVWNHRTPAPERTETKKDIAVLKSATYRGDPGTTQGATERLLGKIAEKILCTPAPEQTEAQRDLEKVREMIDRSGAEDFKALYRTVIRLAEKAEP
jgi:hypothetical protein